MTTPRFPPRGTPQYWAFIEEWLIKERVDNDRQWRYLRETTKLVTGLNPVRIFVELGFTGIGSGIGSGAGSGSGSGHASGH